MLGLLADLHQLRYKADKATSLAEVRQVKLDVADTQTKLAAFIHRQRQFLEREKKPAEKPLQKPSKKRMLIDV